jgi:hypothetical protein
MSHFTTIKTEIRDENALVAALADVGYAEVERHPTAQHLYGYQGDRRAQTAEVIIRRKYVGSASNDIGFKRQADGTFEAIISEFDRQKHSQHWVDQVAQRYAYHVVLTEVAKIGGIVEQESVRDGEIELVVCEQF